MDCITAGDAREFAFVARRNNSLSASARALVLASLAAVSFGIALTFAVVFGAWLVMPFAGVEMAALYLAFRHVGRHAADYERIAIGADRVSVEVFDGGSVSRFGFNRCWAQVGCTGDGSRLVLKSHGREVEIGRHMNGEQRLRLARELKRGLRSFGRA